MSFDIYFLTSRQKKDQVESENPFTGEKSLTNLPSPITEDERYLIKDILSKYGATQPDRFGFYSPVLEDGTTLEMNFKGLYDDPEFTGGAIHLRESSIATFNFIFKVAAAGNFIVIPVMEDNPTIVTSLEIEQSINSEFPNVVVVTNGSELAEVISGGINVWEKYRDKVVNKQKTT